MSQIPASGGAFAHHSPNGLRAIADNMRALASALNDSAGAKRARTMADRYDLRARKIEGAPLTKSDELRGRAAAILALLKENPEPQWQRARLLAKRYLAEAEAFEKAARCG